MSDSKVDILIVDDRPENLVALEAILEPLNQPLVRASSGEEALRELIARDVAVILLDVRMPGMDGFETARLIRSRERTRHVPVIFLTAISEEEQSVVEGYSLGAVDYVFKPFRPEILRAKVAAFIELHLRQKRIEERYSEIVRSAMDAIVIFDEETRVCGFNAAAERMFSRTADEVMGEPVTRLFPSDIGAAVVEQIRRVAAAGCDGASSPIDPGTHPRVTSFTAARANGDTFPVEASVSCLDASRVEAGQSSACDREGRQYTLIVRDISERVRQETALREQAASLANTMSELRSLNEELNLRQVELERAMTARTRFYASMSHELRTPINAVIGYSTLLLESIYGPLNEKQQEGIERTQKAARHLLELVNDVLDLSKIEAGKIDLRLQSLSFPSLIEDLFVTVCPLADEYGSKLTLDHRGEPIQIVSDPRRVRQILLNLLSNAVKFGSGKPVRVIVRARDGGGVVVEVADEGVGIAPEDQERIFQEFVQLSKSPLHEGTGLGLPISRRLAELLRGSLEVRSEVRRGSVFRLSLPPTVEPRGTRTMEHEVAHRATDERVVAGEQERARLRPQPSRIAG